MKLCCVKDCDRAVKAKGMCQTHYRRSIGKIQKPLSAPVGQKHFHNMTNHPLYKLWSGMKNRCNNPAFKQYADYGGRGIVVCESWYNFANFVGDIGERLVGATLERADNDGNYEPDNVRWATRREQMLNQRISRRNKTGTSGVHWDKNRKKWLVNIQFNNKQIFIGRFTDKNEAIAARQVAEKDRYEQR